MSLKLKNATAQVSGDTRVGVTRGGPPPPSPLVTPLAQINERVELQCTCNLHQRNKV